MGLHGRWRGCNAAPPAHTGASRCYALPRPHSLQVTYSQECWLVQAPWRGRCLQARRASQRPSLAPCRLPQSTASHARCVAKPSGAANGLAPSPPAAAAAQLQARPATLVRPPSLPFTPHHMQVHNESGSKRVIVTKSLPGERWLQFLTNAGCRVEVSKHPDIILDNATIKKFIGSKCDGVIGQLTEVRGGSNWPMAAIHCTRPILQVTGERCVPGMIQISI
jgi:hypothetical protein